MLLDKDGRGQPLFRPINCIPYILVEKYDPERKGGLGGGGVEGSTLFYSTIIYGILFLWMETPRNWEAMDSLWVNQQASKLAS